MKLSDFWLKWYCDFHCTLCGNVGIIDSRGVRTPAGVPVGRLNWCICPNGTTMRRQRQGNLPTQRDLEWHRR